MLQLPQNPRTKNNKIDFLSFVTIWLLSQKPDVSSFVDTARFNIKDIPFKSFRTGEIIAIDDLVIKPIHVDYSFPGAYGFIIHTSSGAVVYGEISGPTEQSLK